MRVSVIDGDIDQSINHYFIVCPNVDQRAGQLSLPDVGITKTERNRTKNLNSMSISYIPAAANINLQ